MARGGRAWPSMGQWATRGRTWSMVICWALKSALTVLFKSSLDYGLLPSNIIHQGSNQEEDEQENNQT